MKRSRFLPLVALAALLPLLLAGCDSAPTDPFEPGEPVALALQVSTTAEMVQTIVVEVTGQGIPVPILANLEMVDGTASGTIVVPAGQDRTFTARGFDAEGGVTHEGSVTEDVRPGQPVVRIPLVPRGVGVPIEVVASFYIVSIDPAATEMNIGEERQFTATVTEAGGQPVDVDPTTLRWGSSNPVMATVDAAGLVSAGGIEGSVRIGVSYQGVAAESALTITGDDLLSISLAPSASVVEPGENFEVVTTIRNRGDEPLYNVEMMLRVPYSDVVSEESGGSCMVFPHPEEATAFVCWISEFLPGAEVTWPFTTYSVGVQGVTLSVNAAITSWNGPEDPYLGNNEANAEIAVTDGRIVFASDRNGPMNLFIANPDGTGLHQLTDHPAAETYPAWSRDRSQIAFIRSGSLWVINADGTGETQLNVPADNRPTWSPDGKRIAVSGRPAASDYLQILIYDLETGSYTNLMSMMDEQWLTTDWRHPDWSPNSDELVAVRSTDVEWENLGGGGFLTGVRLDGSTFSIATYFSAGGACFQGGPMHQYPRWSPDKSAIAVSGGMIFRDEPDESGLTCDRYSFMTSVNPGDLVMQAPSWSPNGEHLVFGAKPTDSEGATFDLVTIRSDGTGPMQNITNWPSNDIQPHW